VGTDVRNIELDAVDEHTHLLERFRLDEAPVEAVSGLTPLQQALVLARAEHIVKTSPVDAILSDELRAYVSRVVEAPRNTLVQWCALLTRSRMELKVPRRRERAMLQFQEAAGAQDDRIRAQFSGGGTTQRHRETAQKAAKARAAGVRDVPSDFAVPGETEAPGSGPPAAPRADETCPTTSKCPSSASGACTARCLLCRGTGFLQAGEDGKGGGAPPGAPASGLRHCLPTETSYANDAWTSATVNSAPVRERTRHAHALAPSSRWSIQKELGEMYLGLGMVKNALAIFEPLELWDGVVSCMIVMGRKAEARRMIEERIARRETPDLLCLLGSLLSDDSYFLRAWELSGGRFGRAMRQLGEM
jgi:hypothetical protein